MPITTELTVQLEDRPGTIGKMCLALGNRGITIIALQASSFERRTEVRLVVDDPAAARIVLDGESMAYTESEVAQVKLSNHPGDLGRAALRLGRATINIQYAYSGVDPSTNSAVVIFGVGADAARAAAILDQTAVAAGVSRTGTKSR